VAILPADLPLLRPADIVALVARARTADVVLAPDRRRDGTNALVLSSPLALTLAPRFGPSSYRLHLDAARLAGVRSRTVRRRGLAFDLDDADDLRALRASRARPGRHTAAVLARLGTR